MILVLLWVVTFIAGILIGRKRSVMWVERAALAEIEADDRTENLSIDFDVRIKTVVQAYTSRGFEIEPDDDEFPHAERPAPVIITFQRASRSMSTATLDICLFIVLMPFGSLSYVMGLGCIDRQAKRIEFMVEE